MDIWIDQAEASWMEVLYQHAEAIFRNSTLPSHDHTHHLRVWNLCKTVLREIKSFNSTCDQSLVEGLMIASFFHDLGMAFSTREDHGRLGRELCKSWFLDSGRDKPELFNEILGAIELHDKKEVRITTAFSREAPPEILEILSVADDLEALGTIGIYRYAEIYLQRDIPLPELGERVLRNVKTRFENLVDRCVLCKQLLDAYRPQYDEIRLFFEAYNLQINSIAQPETVFSGPLGVINHIRQGDMESIARDSGQGEIRDFFRKLAYELDQARI